MREHEVNLILNWVGARSKKINEQMIRDAIGYAYQMGYSDGSYTGPGISTPKESGDSATDTVEEICSRR